MSKFNIVSADSHVVEPAELWQERIAPAFRDRAPKVVREENGDDVFYCDGTRLIPPAGMSQAGKPPATRGRTMADVYPGAYDPKARLAHMRQDGIDAEVLYPSIAMRIFSVPDISLRQACFEAYNSWAADFCDEVPDRFKAVGVIELDDIEGAVMEAKRCAKLGHKGLMVTIASDDASLYSDSTYDAFWATAEELGMPVSLHLITDKKPIKFDMVSDTMGAMPAIQSLANMVFGGLFLRFPKLKVISAENDAGWAGYVMERMDRLFNDEMRRSIREFPIKDEGMLPSDYFRRNIAFTFIHDRTAVETRHWIGLENLMWSSDYPHNDSTFPNSAKTLEYLFKGIPDDERQMIVAGNAERIYGLG